MSDKSFGDHMSRGMVKNPLLSTAVTGLSIEDLTQNAVLLPVSRNQALLGGQEQSETQNYTLAHSDNLTPNFPSGDANFTPIHPTPPPDTNQTQYDNQQNAKNSKTLENTHATVLNAQPKSGDDFDVNEYFARLQGTRYVSAPINSHLKEDGNADLEAKEQNLEEINLNEPGLQPEEQQSITADIAQNFSQLPTVLPQVASAVFSSFSNMLSMKSREHTPDEVKADVGGSEMKYQPGQDAGVGVPLMGVSEVKEVAPPPKEPPVCGPGNFRMTSKKKAYAQIPGLSTGETVQMPNYAPPANQQYFAPNTQTSVNFPNLETDAPKSEAPKVNADSNVFNTAQNIPDLKANVFEVPKAEVNVTNAQYNAPELNPQAPIIPPPPMFSNLAKRDILPGTGKSVLPPSVARRIASNKPTINTQSPTFTNFGNIFVPAPVPSEQDSQTLAPTFPPNVSQVPTLAQSNQAMPSSTSIFTSQVPPSQPFVAASPMPSNNLSSTGTLPPPPTNASVPPSSILSSAGISSFATGSLPPPTNASMQPPMGVPSSAGIPPLPTGSLPPPPSNAAFKQAPMAGISSLSAGNVPPLTQTAFTSPNALSRHSSILSHPSNFAEAQSVPPSIFTPGNFTPGNDSGSNKNLSTPDSANVPLFASESIPMLPTIPSTPWQMLNPYSPGLTPGPAQLSSNEITSQPSSHVSLLDPKYSSTNLNTPAPETKLPEPPKVSGNTNYRMTKKRPQYYSGPIGGIGAISNNVVPTIAPVTTNTFQGALFTPDTGAQGSMFRPEPVINDSSKAASPHGAEINPETVTESANIATACTSYINKQVEVVTLSPFGMVKNRETFNVPYDTAFDVSRQVTDSFEPPKEAAYGIISNIKSKLSSIDVNKIQNSVTTFFDPAYNNQTEAFQENEASTYAPQNSNDTFVPNVESHAQPYNYDAYHANFTYGQSGVPNPTHYYQQQAHNMYSPVSYYSQPVYGTQNYNQEPAQQGYQPPNVPFDTTAVTFLTNNEIIENIMPGYTSPCWQQETSEVKEKWYFVDYSCFAPNEYQKYEAANSNRDIFNAAQPQNHENIEQVMENLKMNADPEATGEQVDLAAHENVEINEDKQIDVNYDMESLSVDKNDDYDLEEPFEGSPEHTRLVEYYDSFGKDDDDKEYSRRKVVEITSLFSTPSRDLTSNIASESQEIYDRVSEDGEQVSFDADDGENIIQQSTQLELAESGDDDSFKDDKVHTSDLNICETCREVSKPEDKEADLTSQLIENITSPIQLLNPVEAPLTESVSNIPVDFDTINQCAEISLIADETVETLQVQSATELLDEEGTNIERNYGWRNDVFTPGHPGQKKPGRDHLFDEFTFKPDPEAFGYLPDNSLFFDEIPKNASDEIKAEFIVSQDEVPIILQRQMSIPTAPPLEDSEDAKSDETSILDVQSIEQDANKDFPVFEEYVIEPSETDDDKMETKDKTDQVNDTFTNRVDRFKKLESSDDLKQHKDFNIGNSTTLMPSYFDTGNYAAETHYKNSLTSPSLTTGSAELNAPFRAPPGFESQYGRKSPDNNKTIEPKVPETFTQTPTTTTSTFSVVRTNVTTTVQAGSPPSQKIPDLASVFGKIGTDDLSISAQVTEAAQVTVDTKKDIAENKIEEKKIESLPDPINFFASATQETNAPETANRLASYFASPPKTDDTKSFFELSQGQDHYRQKDKDGDDKTDNRKAFLKLSQSDGHYKEVANVSHDQYMANLNLMKDLTSIQNMEPNKDQVVKTINYFTVEYDNNTLNFNKGEPSAKDFKKPVFSNNKENAKEETLIDDVNKLKEIVNNCKYCSELNTGPILTVSDAFDSLAKPIYRQAMDSSSGKPKEEVTIMPGKEGERSVNVKMEDVSPDGDNNEGVAMMNENRPSTEYEAVKHHWFYRVDWEGKSTWRGFSTSDSKAIESAFQSPDLQEDTLVPTDGGRYDVNVMGRLRIAVYWQDKPTNVRRCSWFYKGTTDARYVPYTEPVAEKLEEEYRHGMTTGEWHRRLVLPNSELVVMHGPAVMVHFLHSGGADAFSAPNLFTFGKRVYRNPPKFKITDDIPDKVDHLLLLVHGAGEWRNQKEKIQSTMRPRVVRRGFDESEIEDMEPSNIDHLLLLCHGVGSACDMRFRSVEEVVDDFRATSLQLLQSHYRNSYDAGVVGRVEVLPISWHASLHAGPCGVDRRLARVTLASIPRLRSFTNDTVLDVLFYTSPHYCQTILNTVCGELNRVYNLFLARNPNFKGGVSLGGHSLGSVILYDLLCHQEPPTLTDPPLRRAEKQFLAGKTDITPDIKYPKLGFEPLSLYALGSPIAIFECIRGVESLGGDFFLPTCRNFFNIFHPYDPIAYRIEPLVNPQLQNVKPSLIPHHKGRKRMHLELKETMARVGADLKQKLMESIKSTWSSMWASAAPPDHQLEKVVEEEIEKEQMEEDSPNKEDAMQADVAVGDMLGKLNNGRRVDYVLQEAPFEMINEYLFAMSSHVCYWESEDTMLLILREIYDSLGVQADVTVPQQSMSVPRAASDEKLTCSGIFS